MPGRSRKRGRRDAPTATPAPAAGAPVPTRPRSRPLPPPGEAAPGRPPAASAPAPEARTPATRTPATQVPERHAPDGRAPAGTAASAGGRPLPSHLPPPRESRSEARNAEIRATLRPYAPGERPRVVLACAAIAAALALANLICWLAGVKIGGQHPAATGIVIFTVVLLACAGGLWQMRAGAVLGFMCLVAILAILFTLFLIEASNVLGVVVALAIILVSGYLFFKLVRVLSRLQVPRES